MFPSKAGEWDIAGIQDSQIGQDSELRIRPMQQKIDESAETVSRTSCRGRSPWGRWGRSRSGPTAHRDQLMALQLHRRHRYKTRRKQPIPNALPEPFRPPAIGTRWQSFKCRKVLTTHFFALPAPWLATVTPPLLKGAGLNTAPEVIRRKWRTGRK